MVRRYIKCSVCFGVADFVLFCFPNPGSSLTLFPLLSKGKLNMFFSHLEYRNV